MFDSYKLFNIENEPITVVSADRYIFNISKASYLNIENLENSVEVIGSIYVPKNSYEKIIDNLLKYNQRIYDSYVLNGYIVDISYIGPQYSKLEKYIKGKPVEILPEDTLKHNIEMITNDIDLYQLTNRKKGLDMIIKINIF